MKEEDAQHEHNGVPDAGSDKITNHQRPPVLDWSLLGEVFGRSAKKTRRHNLTCLVTACPGRG